MSQKSRELDKKLAAIVEPFGFKKAPNTRVFLRKCNTVFQGVNWYYQPNLSMQHLEWRIESAYQDPMYMFHKSLEDKYPFYYGFIDCVDNEYREEEYIPWRMHNFYGSNREEEEVQLVNFQKEVLPRLERWTNEEDVYLAKQGYYRRRFHEQDSCCDNNVFLQDNSFNLALYLGKYEDAEKYIDVELGRTKQRMVWGIYENGEIINPNQKEYYGLLLRKKSLLNNAKEREEYLMQCKEQNLEEFKKLLSGIRRKNKDGV